jgi:hypothetical protein
MYDGGRICRRSRGKLDSIPGLRIETWGTRWRWEDLPEMQR